MPVSIRLLDHFGHLVCFLGCSGSWVTTLCWALPAFWGQSLRPVFGNFWITFHWGLARSNSQFPWALLASRSPGGKSPEEPLEAPRSS